ncbi:L-seryl-tRNA(Sec) selenium transferase [Nakamurella leprariae]|uniref:L-seryl-tRNA(Sec) selenium transferase n=1 Tax=Nakamurella leprariae TaxID=2803911 RepID=A0A939C3R3_9ACTN|nr:L-seryl-tRNA(Sec) selenium transferase [Nakamurella leprariae]MBM9469347.1 L-seryl-tRNA(Sec) selenium transferase [Nakamurella leprariae]
MSSGEDGDPRRRVPRTDTLLADTLLAAARDRLGDRVVKRAVQIAQDRVRRGELPVGRLLDTVLDSLPDAPTSLRRVINATGVVLHTNLGRAPLSEAAVAAVNTAAGYVDVEFDLTTGTRARRGRGALAALLTAVPDAQDALVVNNGAAALVLAATTLAPGREIVISRGELVEIGDGFRIPELLQSTGARLREVGTTNRTHLADYAAAVSDRTGFILKVHPSNFSMHGFTASVPVDQLATLGVPVVADIGSGLLAADPLLPGEPDAASWLRAGAGLVTASGDKLLGGPQAGLVLGTSELVGRLRRSPIHRALRVDKLTLAALEATLTGPPTPTRAALRADPTVLRGRAEHLARSLQDAGVPAAVVPSDGLVGAGGAPDLRLPGWAVALPEDHAAALRTGRPAVAARVEGGHCLLDLRCVPTVDDRALLGAVLAAAGRIDGTPPCT